MLMTGRRLTLLICSGAVLALGAVTLAGCDGSRGNPPPNQVAPPPATPAPNPFQADIVGRSYALTLAPATKPSPRAQAGSAAAIITITAAKDEICWTITHLAGVPDPSFAYIQRGRAGDTGPVVVPLGTRYQPSGCVTGVAPGLLTSFEARPSGYYLAIHDRAHPFGAIRGQL